MRACLSKVMILSVAGIKNQKITQLVKPFLYRFAVRGKWTEFS